MEGEWKNGGASSNRDCCSAEYPVSYAAVAKIEKRNSSKKKRGRESIATCRCCETVGDTAARTRQRRVQRRTLLFWRALAVSRRGGCITTTTRLLLSDPSADGRRSLVLFRRVLYEPELRLLGTCWHELNKTPTVERTLK